MGKKPGRPFKKSPSKKREHPPEAVAKRKATRQRLHAHCQHEPNAKGKQQCKTRA